jgi:FkbM family methyltransferase
MPAHDADNLALTAAVNELRQRQQMLLSSRFLRLGWRLGFGTPPTWADAANDPLAKMIQEPTAGSDKMADALAHLVHKNFHPQVVLDIGAAKGYWSRSASACWSNAEFFMIDPLTESEASLKRICADKRFNYVLTAVGATPGEHLMNITPDLDGSSLLEFPSPSLQRLVPVETVDRLLTSGQLKPPQLVKLDVQGFELKVLDGGRTLFESTEVFIIEASLFQFMPDCPRVHDVISYMAKNGYQMFDLAGILRRPLDNDLGQIDIVFVKNDSPMIASNRWS